MPSRQWTGKHSAARHLGTSSSPNCRSASYSRDASLPFIAPAMARTPWRNGATSWPRTAPRPSCRGRRLRRGQLGHQEPLGGLERLREPPFLAGCRGHHEADHPDRRFDAGQRLLGTRAEAPPVCCAINRRCARHDPCCTMAGSADSRGAPQCALGPLKATGS
jgi:hypothetical protein